MFAKPQLIAVNSAKSRGNEDTHLRTQAKRMAREWMDKYKIGDVNIDAEHQVWFRLAKRFLMASE